jgi:hypothetical protein
MLYVIYVIYMKHTHTHTQPRTHIFQPIDLISKHNIPQYIILYRYIRMHFHILNWFYWYSMKNFVYGNMLWILGSYDVQLISECSRGIYALIRLAIFAYVHMHGYICIYIFIYIYLSIDKYSYVNVFPFVRILINSRSKSLMLRLRRNAFNIIPPSFHTFSYFDALVHTSTITGAFK